MCKSSSRRHFLATGLALPAAGAASTSRRSEWNGKLRLAASGAPSLRYRILGDTGLKVTEVGFGCMITSDPTVIEAAADIGINFFDTARGYQGGNNERMVGAALKAKRKEIILCTKSNSHSKAQAMGHLETSLRELGTDYIDVWYLHSRKRPADLSEEMLSALETAKQQGKVRFGGFSTHTRQAELLRLGASLKPVDVILVAYNFTMADEVGAAIATARKAGKGVVGMKVMAGGFRRVKPGNPLYDKFRKDGTMLAALKWVLHNDHICTTIPSITDMEQLDENLRAMSASYTEQDRQLLAAQLNYIKPLYCRICGDCDGQCPKGLPVSDMLRHLSYADGYGQFQLGRENFLRLPAKLQDARCADCAECTIQCPNGVRVSERLARAQELFA